MGFEISYQYIKENTSSLLQDQQSLPLFGCTGSIRLLEDYDILHGGPIFVSNIHPMTNWQTCYLLPNFPLFFAFLRLASLASPNSWMVHFHIHHDTMKISKAWLSFPVSTGRDSEYFPLWGWAPHFVAGCHHFSPLVKKWPLSIVVGWNPILKGLYSLNQI